jgi:hypothetical protein
MRIPTLILLAILPLLPACSVVQSKNPLGPRSAAVRDERLEGLWRGDGGNGKSQYTFFTFHAGRRDGSIMEFEKNDVGSISSAHYDFYVTRTPKHSYLNVTNGQSDNEQVFPVSKPGIYSFAEYHFNWLGELVYSMVGGDGIAKAVDQGKLKGKVDRGSKGEVDNIYLTDTSKRMLDYIESSKPKDAFIVPPMKMSKIGGP